MAQDPTAQLARLAEAARNLDTALVAYQQALLAARGAGAIWPKIATTLGTSEGGARWRHKAARDGGEMHLRLCPPDVPQIPAPRGHE